MIQKCCSLYFKLKRGNFESFIIDLYAVRLQINQSVQFRVLTPVLFLLVSSKETVKVAAKLGELSTSLRPSRHSPRNLKETHTRNTEMDLKKQLCYLQNNIFKDTAGVDPKYIFPESPSMRIKEMTTLICRMI